MLPFIIRIDILFEVVSLVISIAISVVALVGAKKTGSRSLTLLSFGFLLMALAMLLRVVLTTWALSFPMSRQMPFRIFPFLILQAQELVYSVVRVAAYAVFLYLYSSYSVSKPQPSLVLVAVTPSLIYNPFFEAVSALIISIIIIQLWKSRMVGDSTYVMYGFLLLMISHVLFLALPLWLMLYFAAQLLQLIALLFFLVAVLSVLFRGQRL